MGNEKKIITVDDILEKEESLLNKAVSETFIRYGKNSTAQNLRDWEAAKKALAAYRARKLSGAGEESFSNLLECLAHLNAEGWKISKSKLYEDQASIKKQTDGSILKKDLDRYANKFLERRDGSDSFSADAEEKLKWETKIARLKAERLEHENEIEKGRYVLKSDMEHQLAARAALLKNSLGAGFIHSRAAAIIALVEGSTGKVNELVEYWLRHVEDAFDNYSRPVEFEIPALNKDESEEI